MEIYQKVYLIVAILILLVSGTIYLVECYKTLKNLKEIKKELERRKMRISGHSGLPESVELRQLEEKYNRQKEKRDQQMTIVCGVLDKMPKIEQRRFLSELIQKYFGGLK